MLRVDGKEIGRVKKGGGVGKGRERRKGKTLFLKY